MTRRFSPFRSAALIALVGSALLLPGVAGAQEVEGTEPNRGGELNLESIDPAVALQRLRPAEGYEVNLFASEQDFPIGNPVALAFDSRGRLWVATMPSYPQYKPGDPPTDRLVVLEDTNGDGRADKYTVFADSLYLAAGFELGDGGVYIAQQPNLMFLKDTTGDGVADERRIILHGFGTEDSHHAIHAFTWGPDGGLYFQEGIFHHSQVETPHGPVRLQDAGVFRYEPHTEKLSVFSAYPFYNPWGHVFDRWGQNFIADASDGSNYFALPISVRFDYPRKPPRMEVFTSRVRPTGGAEIVSSRHFPDDVQGNFLVSNVIGFHGIKNHRVSEEGSGFTSTEAEPLLASSDINFRPIDMEFGPDGALYVVDWFNPLIGHMQYSLRDPRRDTRHGRIWRLTYKGRPLLRPVDLERLSVAELLEQLREYEDRTRYRVRRELRERDRALIRQELARWIDRLDPADPAHEHLLLEALWVYQSRDLFEPQLLERLLRAEDHRARAAATRALRYWLDRVEDPLEILRRQVVDAHPLVRLEAVVALSYLPSAEAAAIALLARRHPSDYYLDYGLGQTIVALEKHWMPVLVAGQPFSADNPEGILFLLERLTPEEVATVRRSEVIDRTLLAHAGISLPTRRVALDDLAARRGSTRTAELLTVLRSLDGAPGSEATLRDLATLLAESPPAELRRFRRELVRLAMQADEPLLRQVGYVALLRSDGVERAWRTAARSPHGLSDLLGAVELVDDAAIGIAIFPRVRSLVQAGVANGAPTDPTWRAAVRSLLAIPGHEEERLALFSDLLERGIEHDLAFEGVAAILKSGWRAGNAEELSARVLTFARGIPPSERSGPAFERLLELGQSLGALLPGEQGARLLTSLEELAVRRIRVVAVVGQMKFDIESFTVEAGQEVELVLDNPDHMPHNLLIVAPGTREAVGRAADAMAMQPDGFAKQFVPEMPEVLFASRLIGTGESDTLRFRAPSAPGDYPFVCTFPGHWITMFGTMQVVPAGQAGAME
jgi:glucose/arabinose dehydrogenase/azurin